MELTFEFEKHHERKYYIGIDIGASNCRIAILFENEDVDKDVQLCKFKANSASALKKGLNDFAAVIVQKMKYSPIGTCLGIAGPIHVRTKATITNYLPEDRDIDVSELNSFAFPPDATIFINDLEAACGGIMALNEVNKLQHYYVPLWNPSSNVAVIPPKKTSLVLAMGTGLGTALIVTDFERKSHYILPMEAGHIYVTELGKSHPHGAKDKELVEFVSDLLYKQDHTIEFEDLCSGRGIGYIYKFLTNETMETDQIARKAFNDKDEKALEALRYVYRFLLRDAQNLCVMSQSKSIFLAGDNQVQNHDFVVSIKDILREEFLNHVKRAWLEDVDVWTQNVSANFNLYGAFFLVKKFLKN